MGLPIFKWEPGVPINEEVTFDLDNEDEIEVHEDEVHENENFDNVDVNEVPNLIPDDEKNDDTQGNDENDDETETTETDEDIDEDDDDLNNEVAMLLGNELPNIVEEEPNVVNDEHADEEDLNEIDLNVENVDDANDDTNETETQEYSRPRRANAGSGVERLNPSFVGKIYHSKKTSQFTQYDSKNEDNHDETKTYMNRAVGVLFTQMTAKRGIKLFGERAIAAMTKEFNQLDKGAFPGKPVVEPIDPTTLTKDEKQRAMEAVNLIKEKRCGKIKGRTCANGSTQRRFLGEGESVSSPTVSIEALFSTLVIDALERRDVAVFDVPGAYLHAKMPKGKKELLKMRGEFVDIMCEVNPEYKPFVLEENGKKVLYMNILRAIYGCIQSALLWYELYVSVLKDMGFRLNPYDRCVTNKMIDGKQCTMVWYVDDNKLSHEDPKVVDEIIAEVEKHFG